MIMIINKLIGLERTLEMENEGIPHSDFFHRQTGRSTSLALFYISSAMINEGKFCKIVNHHYNEINKSTNNTSNFTLMKMIMSIISKLDLKCFVFKNSPPQIKFELFEEYEEKTIWIKKSK